MITRAGGRFHHKFSEPLVPQYHALTPRIRTANAAALGFYQRQQHLHRNGGVYRAATDAQYLQAGFGGQGVGGGNCGGAGGAAHQR